MSSDALVLRAKGQSYSNWPSDHILFFQEGRTEYHTHDVVNKPSTLQPRSEESQRQRNFAEEQARMDFAAMLCTMYSRRTCRSNPTSGRVPPAMGRDRVGNQLLLSGRHGGGLLG